MFIATITGNLGKDAEHKVTQGGKGFAAFPVGVKVGFGEREQTIWVDVTKWGNGSERLADMLTKGTAVTVIGEVSLREHNGKTYVQMSATELQPHLPKRQQPTRGQEGHIPGFDPDDDMSVPF